MRLDQPQTDVNFYGTTLSRYETVLNFSEP